MIENKYIAMLLTAQHFGTNSGNDLSYFFNGGTIPKVGDVVELVCSKVAETNIEDSMEFVWRVKDTPETPSQQSHT